MHGGETEVACESLIPRGEVFRLVEAALDVPVVASNAVQEAPLDVRQVMELAEKIDSFEQISRQLDQRLPGTEPVPLRADILHAWVRLLLIHAET